MNCAKHMKVLEGTYHRSWHGEIHHLHFTLVPKYPWTFPDNNAISPYNAGRPFHSLFKPPAFIPVYPNVPTSLEQPAYSSPQFLQQGIPRPG
jgi:hypothetical protein